MIWVREAVSWLCLLLGIVNAASGSVPGAAANLELLHSDATGLTLRWTIGVPELRGDGMGRALVDLPGADHLAQPGEYLLPTRTVRVGLPQAGGFRTGLRPGPVRRYDCAEPAVAVAVSSADLPDSQPAAGGSEPEILSVGPVEELRGIRFVELTLRPCRYDRDARQLAVREWLEVNVEFESRPVEIASPDPMDGLVSSMLLNGETAVSWKPAGVDRDWSFFDRSANWLKLSVSETGIHAVTGRELAEAGVAIDGVDPRTLAMYTLGEYAVNGPYPDTLVPVAIHVEREQDGRLRAEDRVVFFARAADHWVNHCSTWIANPYTGRTVYWLTWGLEPGRRMSVGLGPDTSGSPVVSAGRWREHQEENQDCPARSGLLWIWRTMLKDSHLPGVSLDIALTPATPVRLLSLAGRLFATSDANALSLSVNGTLLDTLNFSSAPASQPYLFSIEAAVPLMSRANSLRLELTGEGARRVMLDWLEFDYLRLLSLADGQCRFLQDDTGSFRFRVRDAVGPVVALDVTDPMRPMMADGIDSAGGSATFARRVGRPSEFCVSDARHLLKPDAVEFRRPGRLRSTLRTADYWVVAPPEYLPAARRLARYRAGNIAWLDRARAEAVALDDVYDDYSYGMEEPGAIKRFFADKRPVYGVLAGDATYDYRDNLRLRTAPTVPAHEVGHSLDPSGITSREAYALDAWYADFEGEGGSPDMILGRVTCRSGSELAAFVDKVIAYESGPPGLWSRRMLLLADDEWSGDPSRPDPIGFRHIEQCEAAAAAAGIQLDPSKVYLTEHSFAGVKNKPGARAELMRELQAGSLVFFFFGHGDAFDLCHESVLNISQIADVDCGIRSPFCYFGSCSVGRFEDTKTECIAEELVRKPEGGAIAAVGATKATTSGTNSVFARNLQVPLLSHPDSTVGAAFFKAWPTDRLYHLFGDPATRLRLAADWPEPPAVRPDSLRPGAGFRARALVGWNEGPGEWRLSGPARTRTYTSARGTWLYVMPGVTLGRGNIDVLSGRLELDGRFPLGVALDTVRVENGSYAPVPNSCRLAAVIADSAVGLSLVTDRLAWDPVPVPSDDSCGPVVRLFLEGVEILDGAVLPADFEVEGVVEDPAGVLVAPVPGWTPSFQPGRAAPRAELADRLIFDGNSNSTARFRLPVRLTPGEDTLQVVASDNLLNRTHRRVAVLVLPGSEPLRIDSVRVFPNPVAGRAWFTFEVNRAATVSVRVFTLAGRLARDLGEAPAAFGYNQFEWDGRDGQGNPLANGVYLFTVTARAFGAAGPETVRVRDRLLVLH
ncbi:MAG: C25 family cysteine peptidase [bacterium]